MAKLQSGHPVSDAEPAGVAGGDANPAGIAIDPAVGRIVVHRASVLLPIAAFVNRSPLAEAG